MSHLPSWHTPKKTLRSQEAKKKNNTHEKHENKKFKQTHGTYFTQKKTSRKKILGMRLWCLKATNIRYSLKISDLWLLFAYIVRIGTQHCQVFWYKTRAVGMNQKVSIFIANTKAIFILQIIKRKDKGICGNSFFKKSIRKIIRSERK